VLTHIVHVSFPDKWVMMFVCSDIIWDAFVVHSHLVQLGVFSRGQWLCLVFSSSFFLVVHHLAFSL
jgi:hypothetical protein